jgi:uncharacterized protein (DUF1778 family)
MKKHAGRPRLGTQNAKGVFINARFTPAEATQIKAAAAKSGLSQSNFVRKYLLSSANAVNVPQ